MTHYSILMGSSGGGEAASSYVTKGAGQSFTITIPTGYNALHIQYSVGGGGGATGGISYDKAGGESSGRSGGSGAYISDIIFSVNEGSSYSASTGSGGSGGNQTANFGHPKVGSSGSLSKVNGLFQLNPGGGASLTGGGVQGPLATGGSNGSAGSLSITGTRITSGFFFNSSNDLITIGNVSELRGGPRGTFNSSGNGSSGGWNGNCGGDNCRIGGRAGATSYGGSVAGGTASSSSGSGTNGGNGSRGSGGGGGAAQVSGGGNTRGGSGGGGEMKYRFLNVFGN